jgi:hypothetical protein
MRFGLVLIIASLVALAACGKEIGDECIISADCSPNGDRQCDIATMPGGYCTIQGCDLNTCPSEATCVRFFTGNFSNRPCDPTLEDRGEDKCSLDELCSLAGKCVPRSSEIRFCMRLCDSNSDCRDGFECRDVELMKEHGGEPVLPAGQVVDDKAPKFCALAPS